MNPYFNCPFSPVIIPGQPMGGTIPQMQPQYLQPGMMQLQPGIVPMYQLPGTFMPGMENMYPMDMEDQMDVGPGTASPGDPPPILSDNPVVPSITAFKELTGYPNYGNPSGNADILYTGNRGVWNFNLPAFLSVPGQITTGRLVIRGVLDDHSSVPVNRYSARITFNGTQVFSGRLSLEHGRPVGGRFTNWRELTFEVSNVRRNNRVVIVNTSNAGDQDWMGIDWMELRLGVR